MAKKKPARGPSRAAAGEADVIAVARDAGRRFGGRTALRGVSLSIAAGEVVGIVGPNGGGKSTLLMLFAGLLRPSTGTVTVTGVPAHELAATAAGHVGLVTARPGLYPLLTGWENLRHFVGLFGLDRKEIEEGAAPLLEAFDLGGAMDERVARWSTGMKQKLSLVRALLPSPKLLLFDEPTANVDPLAAATLYAQLRRRADRGLACALVTHDLASAESICDRALVVDVEVRREVPFSGPRRAPSGPLLEAFREAVGSR